MKKKIKFILSILLIIILLLMGYIILVIKGILPNPFLDTSDLVCIRDESNATVDEKVEREMIFNFDKNATIESYTEELKYIYSTEEETVRIYEELIKDNDYVVERNKNIISLISNFKIEKDKGYYGFTKNQIKVLYEKELNYSCE